MSRDRRYARRVGYRHRREDLLAAGAELVLDEGLGALTFGSLARRLGISDRMVVYYFPTKSELVTAVVAALGERLQQVLDGAFGPDPLPVDELMERAWPTLANETSDRVFSVVLELLGLAAGGRSPYRELAPLLIEGWVEWLEPRVVATDPARARDEILALLARVDGLLLLRLTGGPELAERAAQVMGVVPHSDPHRDPRGR